MSGRQVARAPSVDPSDFVDRASASGETPRGPYLGPASYREQDAKWFFGRDDDRRELEFLVRGNLVTVLFGKSGLGKTSLLRAGLFPALREQLFPIPVRFNITDASQPMFGALRDIVLEQARRRNVEVECPDVFKYATVRQFFRETFCWSYHHRLLEPLLVIDQFEELFTLDRARRNAFAAELAELANPRERTMREDGDEAGTGPRPRLLLSLREDYLADLEDLKSQIPGIMRSRYRLRPMTGRQALEAVTRPPGARVSSDGAEAIIWFFTVDASKGSGKPPLDDLEIEPALLSTLCQELEFQRGEEDLPEITQELTQRASKEIVQSFYKRGFASLPDREKLREFVEDALVVHPGLRTTIAVEKAKKQYGVTDEGIEQLRRHHLVRIERRFMTPHVELIHDRLVEVAFAGRVERQEWRASKQRNRRRRRWLVLFGLVALLGAICVTYLVMHRHADSDQVALREKFRNTLAEQGRQALLRDELPTAARLLDLAGEQQPRSQVADVVLGRALASLHDVRQSVQHVPDVTCVRLRSDLGRLLTCGADGTARIWPLAEHSEKVDSALLSVPAIRNGAPSDPPRLIASHGADWVLAIESDGNATVVGKDGPHPALRAESDPATPAGRAGWDGCIAPDDRGFAMWSPGQPRSLRRWRKDDGGLSPLEPGAAPALAEAVCLDGGGVVAVTAAGDVVRFDVDKSEVATLMPRSRHDDADHIAAAPDGSLVVVARSGSARIDVWRAGKMDRFIGPARVDQLAVGSDLLLAVTVQPRVRDDVDMQALWSANLLTTSRPPASSWNPFPARSGESSTLITAWDLKSHQMVFSLERRSAVALLAPRGDTLAVRSDHQIELWDTATWRMRWMRATEGRARPLFDVSTVGSGGAELAVADGAVVRVLEAVNPSTIERRAGRAPELYGAWPITPHPRPIVFSPDGRWAAAAGDVQDWVINLEAGDVTGTPFGAELREVLGAWLSDGSVVAAQGGRTCRTRLTFGAPRRVSCSGSLIGSRASIVAAHPSEPRVLVVRETGAAEWVSFAGRPSSAPFALPAGARPIALCFTGASAQLIVARDDGSISRIDADGVRELPLRFPGVTRIRGSRAGDIVIAHRGGVDIIAPDDAQRHIDVEATDAVLVERPARRLWACDGSGCTAWNPDTQVMLAALRTDMPQPQLSDDGRFVSTGRELLLLPVPPIADAAVLRASPVRAAELSERGEVIAQNAAGENELGANGTVTQLPPAGGAFAGPSFGPGGTVVVPSGDVVRLGPSSALREVWKGSGTIAALAWDRERRRFVVADTNLAVAIVDAGSRSIVVRDPGTVRQSLGRLAMFDPTGKRFAVLVSTGEIQIHRTESGGSLATYSGASAATKRIEFAKDTVLAVSEDSLAVWSRPDTPPVQIPGHYEQARLAPDGAHLVALQSGHVSVWTIPLTSAEPPLRAEANAFDIDSTATYLLLTIHRGARTTGFEIRWLKGDFDKLVDMWNETTIRTTAVFVPGGQRVWMPEAHVLRTFSHKKNQVTRLRPDEQVCALGGDGRYAIICDEHGTATYRALPSDRTASVLQAGLIGMAPGPWAPDGRGSGRLQAPTGDILWIFDRHPGSLPRKLQLRTNEQFCLDPTDPDVVWSLADNGIVTRWSVRMGQATTTRTPRVTVALGSSRARMVVASDTSALTLFELPATGGAVVSTPLLTTAPGPIAAAAIESSGRWFVVGWGSGAVQAFDLDAPTLPPHQLRAGGSDAWPSAIAVASTSTGPVAAIGRQDGTAELWPFAGGEERYPLAGHSGRISSVAFDAEAKWLATASSDGTVRVWEVATGGCITKLTPHPDHAASTVVAFAPGATPALLSASENGDLFVWDVFPTIPARAEIQRLLNAWSPSGGTAH